MTEIDSMSEWLEGLKDKYHFTECGGVELMPKDHEDAALDIASLFKAIDKLVKEHGLGLKDGGNLPLGKERDSQKDSNGLQSFGYVLEEPVNDKVLSILNDLDAEPNKMSWILYHAIAFVARYPTDSVLRDWISAIESGRAIYNPATDKDRLENIVKQITKQEEVSNYSCPEQPTAGWYVSKDDFNFLITLAKKGLINE